MNEETNPVHLFTQHQIILYIIAGLVIFGLLISLGLLIERWNKRK